MNKNMLPHIIAIGTFVIFIVLGFASTTLTPEQQAANQAYWETQRQAEQQVKQEALAIFGSKSNRNAESCLYNGWYRYKSKNYNTAIKDFSEAIYLTPNHPLPFYLRGNAYYAINNYDAAISDYSQALRLNKDGVPIPPYPYMTNAISNNGCFYSLGGGESMEISNSQIRSNRAWTYNLKGYYDSAIDDYNQLIQQDKWHGYYNNRGLVYHNKKEYDLAIADFTQALQRYPSFGDGKIRYYNNRGWSYYNKGDYDKAIDDYTQALQLNSNDATLFNRRGLSFEKKKTYYQAVSDFTQAVRLDPVNTEYGANLERVRQLQGNSR